jgi:hypothetical protein
LVALTFASVRLTAGAPPIFQPQTGTILSPGLVDEMIRPEMPTCRRAMTRNGRLLLVEMVVPEPGANCFSKLLDLNMLVMTGGRERTKSEFCTLFNAAGYKLTRVVLTLAPQSVIEAIPA